MEFFRFRNLRKPAVCSAMLLLLSAALCACGHERIRTPEENMTARTGIQKEFDTFCNEIFREELADADTLSLHYTLLNPETCGIEPAEVSLGTCSIVDMVKDHGEIRTLRDRLSGFSKEDLTEDQQLLYDALMETLNTGLMASGLELYKQPLAPTIGVQAQLPILLAEYPFTDTGDVEDYLALIRDLDRYYEEILVFENQKADAGLAPSDASIDAILESCRSYLIDPETNFLTETFCEKLAALQDSGALSEDQATVLNLRHREAIRKHFIPAYESLIRGMTALKGRGLNDGGLAGFKDGKKYYEYLLRSGPGLSYSVPELKAALTSRIQEDYLAITDLFSRYPSLTDHISAPFTLTDPERILEDLKQKMANDFPALPDCRYEIRYVPKYLEQSLSPAFYLTAPLDDPDRNTIYINNGYSDATDGLYTTLAHEGFPGHLYQTVYCQVHASHPLLSLLGCSGANEGWATYVENYACTSDNGLPPGVGEYRALSRSFSLCVHGILDIGINYDGWSKERAAEFITSCFQADQATIDELWQVMIDNPTNYLEYCGGYVEIMEMRKEAEETLGNRFSLPEFHRFLLDTGPVPFSVTRRYFKIWLTKQEKTPAAQTSAA